ncbi:hypothetical protein QEZ52_18820 [Aliisedimentitalea scapharcae]|uniref:Uncharacterized protein n=1 Tax=Aliisedimentitalea scapharcae TaxID=1524259 RepID=A0ABZ2XRB1_9RHOB|nr:hypothetical protein K3727_03610 [Rhodobacteraceae bacterium M382]
MMLGHWALIALAATSNVVLNLCLRKASRMLDLSGAWPLVLSLLQSVWMWLAVVSAVTLIGAFMAAIRVYSLSMTYTAITALAMVALTVIGALAHSEQISSLRIAGLTLIILGLCVSAFAETGS